MNQSVLSFAQEPLLTILVLPLAPTYDGAELFGTQVLDVGRRQADGQQMLMEGDTMCELKSRRSEQKREKEGVKRRGREQVKSQTHLKQCNVIVMCNGHVILRMWYDRSDLDLLRCVGKGIATCDTQLYGPILQINDSMTV